MKHLILQTSNWLGSGGTGRIFLTNFLAHLVNYGEKEVHDSLSFCLQVVPQIIFLNC